MPSDMIERGCGMLAGLEKFTCEGDDQFAERY
jgi:hypothetical protein